MTERQAVKRLFAQYRFERECMLLAGYYAGRLRVAEKVRRARKEIADGARSKDGRFQL
jgi:hypothetical protein